MGVEGVRAKRKEGRAACSHGAETAALHLNDDKSRSFEDTGRLGYKRGKGVVQRPVDSQTGGRRPDQCISPVEQAEKERRSERRLVGETLRRSHKRGGNEYIAVIIAIDFYRQTITLDSWRLPSCSDDAFFSSSFLSSALFSRSLSLSLRRLLSRPTPFRFLAPCFSLVVIAGNVVNAGERSAD